MNNWERHIIANDATIKEALIRLNHLGNAPLTLFVVDRHGRVEGSITDGDIRRKLVLGISLEVPVKEVMHTSFKYVCDENQKVGLFKQLRLDGIKLLPYLNEEKQIITIYDLNKTWSVLPVDAVLMAGGKGERLRPLTENMPKPLLPVGGKAIIDYNIDRLISYGISHISVTVNYLKEQIERHFEEEREHVKVNCVREPEYLGTIGSVRFVKTFFHDTILVMNSDLFTNINYDDFYLYYSEQNADMAVAVMPYSVTVPYGILEMEESEIISIREKPTYNYYANAGVYLIKEEHLKLIPPGRVFNATDFMKLLIEKGLRVVRFPIVGYWIDIGNKEDYLKAKEIVKHL